MEHSEIKLLSLFITDGDNEKIEPNDLDNPFMSWDVLMGVIQKCKDTQVWGSQSIIDEIDNSLINCNIQSTYEYCIKYVEAYNSVYRI